MPDSLKLIQQFQSKKSPLEPLISSTLDQYGLQLYLKRDDLIDPALSGNKWRKLYLNLLEALRLEKRTLLTFGGAYSNHIYAIAAAGKLFGFETIGLIRGEKPKEFGHTLQFAAEAGMTLRFLSREVYRKKSIPPDIDISPCYILPEGGSNYLGVKGCEMIVDEVREQIEGKTQIDYWCVSSGTGGTASGIISRLEGESEVLVFSALKGDFLKAEIEGKLKEVRRRKTEGKTEDGRPKTEEGREDRIPDTSYRKPNITDSSSVFGLPSSDSAPHFHNWQLLTNFHFGGYAKFKPELIQFINQFKSETGIPLDPVYTGKMMFGIFDLAAKGFFKRGSTIVAVHTGGLQGVVGFNERHGGLLL